MARTIESAASKRAESSLDPVRRQVARLIAAWLAGGAVALLVVWSEMRTTAPSRDTALLQRLPEPKSIDAKVNSIESTHAVESTAPSESTAPATARSAIHSARLAPLLIPVQGVSASGLSRQFDDARSGGRAHRAIDILAPRSTPVLAATGGRIARLHQSALGGVTIYQYDESGHNVFYYAHLERYAPKLAEGDEVRRGDVIGFVGTTGNAPQSTPHLHFAIFRLADGQRWWEGTPIDPYDALVERRLAQR